MGFDCDPVAAPLTKAKQLRTHSKVGPLNALQVYDQADTLGLKGKLNHATQICESWLFADGQGVGVAKARQILLQPWSQARTDENDLATTRLSRPCDLLDLYAVRPDRPALG